MYLLLDLEMLSASMEITYSVHVVLRVRFAERRNFPFSKGKAMKEQSIMNRFWTMRKIQIEVHILMSKTHNQERAEVVNHLEYRL